MIDAIFNYLAGINRLFAVFIVSMFPIVELRGAIPLGVGLGLDLFEVYIVSVIGNMLPVPFIVLFIRPIIEWLKKFKFFAKIVKKFEEKTLNKSDRVRKYKILGLFIFVAIPLPGTGAWTGAALAGLMNMRLKHSVPAIFFGVVTAGVIMMLLSYGLFNFILNMFA